MPTKLSWSHITELMILSNEDEINYYISVVNDRNIGYRKLGEIIKNNEYGRIDEETKNKLKNKEELKVPDLVKNPIQIRNTSDYNEISEKVLQKLILEDIPSFLKELGNGFSFIDSEYKIKIGDRYNYIDLLLFNYEFNCFVVVELKVSARSMASRVLPPPPDALYDGLKLFLDEKKLVYRGNVSQRLQSERPMCKILDYMMRHPTPLSLKRAQKQFGIATTKNDPEARGKIDNFLYRANSRLHKVKFPQRLCITAKKICWKNVDI